MRYSKECVSGKPLNLKEYGLYIIRQPIIDDFMSEYDLSDFIKPFYIMKWLVVQNEEIDKFPFTYYIVMSTKDNTLYNDLIKSLRLLYDTKEIELVSDEDDYKLLIKKDKKPIAVLDDSNFNVFSEIILEICKYDLPKKENKPQIKGDPEKVKRVLEERAKYEAKHKKDNTILFENMVRDVMYYRKITYDQIKSWTVFQIKDAYIVECLREQEEREWLLVSSGNYKIDIKEIKHWKDVTKLK